MSSSHRPHQKHERNLERDLDWRREQPAPHESGSGRRRSHDAPVDPGAKLARDAVQREAARRARGRTAVDSNRTGIG
jgi:hypothetical protein